MLLIDPWRSYALRQLSRRCQAVAPHLHFLKSSLKPNPWAQSLILNREGRDVDDIDKIDNRRGVTPMSGEGLHLVEVEAAPLTVLAAVPLAAAAVPSDPMPPRATPTPAEALCCAAAAVAEAPEPEALRALCCAAAAVALRALRQV